MSSLSTRVNEHTARWWRTPAYVIHTPRTTLRCLGPADALAVGEVLERSRAHLAPWIDILAAPLDRDAMVARLRAARGSFDLGLRFEYGVWVGNGDELAGAVTLHPTRDQDGFSLTYWLDVDMQGQGYATEAVAALTRVAFELAAAAYVEIRCEPDNVRSAKLAERLGYAVEGRLCARGRVAGERRDQLVWTLHGDGYADSPVAGLAIDPRDALDEPIMVEDEPPAWSALVSHVRATRQLLVDEPTTISFAWHGRAQGEPVERAVTIRLGDAYDRPWITVESVVCREDALPIRDALSHNATLAVGALCLVDAACVLRHAEPLGARDSAALIDLASQIADEASRLHARLETEPRTATGLFSGYLTE